MSTTCEQTAAAEPPGPPPSIRWRNWPVRDVPARALLAAIGLLAVTLAVRWLTGQTYLALLALAALLIAVWRLFVPVVFELSHEGVGQHVLGRKRRIAWQAIRRHEIGPDGVLLLPYEDRSPLDPFCGLYLPWAGHCAEVLAQVGYYLGQPGDQGSGIGD